jgi:hypothetical protein
VTRTSTKAKRRRTPAYKKSVQYIADHEREQAREEEHARKSFYPHESMLVIAVEARTTTYK